MQKCVIFIEKLQKSPSAGDFAPRSPCLWRLGVLPPAAALRASSPDPNGLRRLGALPPDPCQTYATEGRN